MPVFTCPCVSDLQWSGLTQFRLFTMTLSVLTSVFLYRLAKEEASFPSVHNAAVLRRWIARINDEVGEPKLKATQKVMGIVWKRAQKVCYRVKCLRHGRQQAAFLSQDSRLTLLPTDVKTRKDEEIEQRLAGALKENQKLLNDKAKLANSESKLMDRVARLSDQLRKSTQGSHSTVSRGRRVSRSKKSPSDYTKRHRRNLKRKRKQSCVDSLSWLDLEGYTATKLELLNNKTGEKEVLNHIEANSADFLGPDETSVSDESLDAINMALYVKDRYISGDAYHEMAQLFKGMPRHSKLKDRIAELNRLWEIKPTPSGTCGVQQSLQSRLTPVVQQLIRNSNPDDKFLNDRKLRVKLTGDGTNIGKRLHVVNFGFTLLDEGDKAYSADGNHCLAIIKEPESFESLEKSLADIVREVESLTSITVDGHTFSITYFLGGDWKFLALATGIDSASSTYACIWCKCPDLERHSTSLTWSMSNPMHGARTVEENTSIAASRKKQYNVSHRPLFPTIPLTRVVVDNLHMFLRVADTLIDLLISELRRRDSLEKVRCLRSFDHGKYTNLAMFEKVLKDLGISGYNFWVGKELKKLKWRTLTGPGKLRVFRNINIVDLFGDSDKARLIQSLWDDLINVNKALSARPQEITSDSAKQFETKAKAFVDKFVTIYPIKHVTPYMHCMMHHVREFMHVIARIVTAIHSAGS